MLYSLGFTSFTNGRDFYGSTEIFYKKCRETLKENVKRGIDHPNYAEIDESLFIRLISEKRDYKHLASELGISERTVYDKSYELLGMSLSDAERIYTIYLEIEKKLLKAKDPKKHLKSSFLEDLILAGLSVNQIDAEVLKILIALGYSKKNIEEFFAWDHYHVTKWIPSILGMDFYRARDKFWWKPRVIWLFRQGYSARQMRLVSKRLIGKNVTQDLLIRIFSEEYKIHGSNTWQYLKSIYGLFKP